MSENDDNQTNDSEFVEDGEIVLIPPQIENIINKIEKDIFSVFSKHDDEYVESQMEIPFTQLNSGGLILISIVEAIHNRIKLSGNDVNYHMVLLKLFAHTMKPFLEYSPDQESLDVRISDVMGT